MTFKQLESIIKENNIPKDVKLMSDSGWECGPTDMDGVYYHEEDNKIVFTQYSKYHNTYPYHSYESYPLAEFQIKENKNWKCLYNKESE